jgi:hypothetical protein
VYPSPPKTGIEYGAFIVSIIVDSGNPAVDAIGAPVAPWSTDDEVVGGDVENAASDAPDDVV